MTSTSLDISSKINRTVLECLATLQKKASELEIDMLLVGATAREFLFVAYGINGRATVDVDIGVMVGGWNVYDTLIQRLSDLDCFTADTKIKHRLIFHEHLPVDIIPFGSIETEEGNIVWPDDTGTMSVAGFQDACKHALSADIGRGLNIRLASLPGMAILKIMAWYGRRNRFPTKDAEDLALILNNYASAGNLERLYDAHSKLITDVDGDLELAGARLLGHDMAAIMSKKTKQAVREILARNTIPGAADKLVEAIFRHLPGREYERALQLFQNLKEGIGGEEPAQAK